MHDTTFHRMNRPCAALLAGLSLCGWTASARAATPAGNDPHLVARWSFDSTNTDRMIYPDPLGHNAVPGDPAHVQPYTGADAPFGSAVTFDGQKGAYLTIPRLSGIQKTSFTVAVWVNLPVTTANFVLTDWDSWTKPGFVLGVDPVGAGGKALTIADLASPDVDPKTKNRVSVARQQSKRDVPLNSWHHLAWVWTRTDARNGTIATYLDGDVLVAARKQSHQPVDIAMNDHPMRIGGRELMGLNFTGSMDELWVFGDALTQQQIQNLMNYNHTFGSGPPLARPLVKTDIAAAVPATPAATPAATPPATPAADAHADQAKVADAATGTDAHPIADVTHTDANHTDQPTQTELNADNKIAAATPAVSDTPAAVPTPAPTPAPDSDTDAKSVRPAIGRSTPLGTTTPPKDKSAKIAALTFCALLEIAVCTYLVWAFKARSQLSTIGVRSVGLRR